MTPIVMGVQDYDKYFGPALARLKAAGLDKIVAEYQTQLTAAIAAQK
jgi:putative aldouronate transport system substrate-binding protein